MDTNIRSDILADPASAQAFSFRWSPLPDAAGPRVLAAPSLTGVVCSASVDDRSTTLPFAMAATREGASGVVPRPLNN